MIILTPRKFALVNVCLFCMLVSAAGGSTTNTPTTMPNTLIPLGTVGSKVPCFMAGGEYGDVRGAAAAVYTNGISTFGKRMEVNIIRNAHMEVPASSRNVRIEKALPEQARMRNYNIRESFKSALDGATFSSSGLQPISNSEMNAAMGQIQRYIVENRGNQTGSRIDPKTGNTVYDDASPNYGSRVSILQAWNEIGNEDRRIFADSFVRHFKHSQAIGLTDGDGRVLDDASITAEVMRKHMPGLIGIEDDSAWPKDVFVANRFVYIPPVLPVGGTQSVKGSAGTESPMPLAHSREMLWRIFIIQETMIGTEAAAAKVSKEYGLIYNPPAQ